MAKPVEEKQETLGEYVDKTITPFMQGLDLPCTEDDVCEFCIDPQFIVHGVHVTGVTSIPDDLWKQGTTYLLTPEVRSSLDRMGTLMKQLQTLSVQYKEARRAIREAVDHAAKRRATEHPEWQKQADEVVERFVTIMDKGGARFWLDKKRKAAAEK